jgi:hypothetical protein
MKRKCLIVVGVLLAVLCAGPAVAQDDGFKFGFFAGVDEFPILSMSVLDARTQQSDRIKDATIGLMIQPMTDFLVKTNLIWNGAWWDDGNLDKKDQYFVLGGELGVYYRLKTFDRTSIYIGPSLLYQYTQEIQYYTDGTTDREEHTSLYQLRLSLAGEHMLSNHFGFFGELGTGFFASDWQQINYDLTGTITSENWVHWMGFRNFSAQLGLVFYF